MAPAGHVVVCQPNNHEVALMGELSAQTLTARGVRGYVVITKTEEVVATESEMRRALVGGMDPVEAYNKYGKF
jgi:regulator of RNase E activity RraA